MGWESTDHERRASALVTGVNRVHRLAIWSRPWWPAAGRCGRRAGAHRPDWLPPEVDVPGRRPGRRRRRPVAARLRDHPRVPPGGCLQLQVVRRGDATDQRGRHRAGWSMRPRQAGRSERFLHMSSTSVYGEEVQLPLPGAARTSSPTPAAATARPSGRPSRWCGGRRDGLPVVVLRPVSVHGPGTIKLLASAILDVAIERFRGSTGWPSTASPSSSGCSTSTTWCGPRLHLIGHDEARRAGVQRRLRRVPDQPRHRRASWPGTSAWRSS